MNRLTTAPNAIDEYIGQRIRLRRNIMGMTQKELALRVGVTFQQIQKYETNGNRISASRLFQIASALETPVVFFFSGLPLIGSESIGVKHYRVQSPSSNDLMSNNETLKLINLYWKLSNDEMRKRIMALLEAMNG